MHPSAANAAEIPVNIDFTQWQKRQNVEAVLSGSLPREYADAFVAPCGFLKEEVANRTRCGKDQAPQPVELPSSVAVSTTSGSWTSVAPTIASSTPKRAPPHTGLSTMLTATVVRPGEAARRGTLPTAGPPLHARYVDADEGRY
jgi:hypothetical protein